MVDRTFTIAMLGAVLALWCGTAMGANDVAWIAGTSSPAGWSIEPARPGDADRIAFSGPTQVYMSRCQGERALGGKPTLVVDSTTKTVELRFEPPASTDCVGFWNPVCGFQGSLDSLERGPWLFFCTQPGATFSLSFMVGSAATGGGVFYVDAKATGANTGLSWADAFDTLQTALAFVSAGFEIRVAEGTYRPDEGLLFDEEDPNASFVLVNGVVVKGGYAGASRANPNERDVVAYKTVLSGDLYGDDKPISRLTDMVDNFYRSDNSYHVVLASGVDETTVLDGFTITGGTARGPRIPDSRGCGGGIYNDDGNPTIRNCVITGNAAAYYGGGVYNRSRRAINFVDCTISGNWTQWWGGGIYTDWYSNIIIVRCVISGNGALYRGGGIYGHKGGTLTLSDCVVAGNTASEPTWGRGGGLYSFLTTAEVTHCTFTGNVAREGASLACDSIGPPDPSKIYLNNCILWTYGDVIWNNDASLVEVAYSDVKGGWPGVGNIDVDPNFAVAGYWDLAGTPEDPCDDLWHEGDYRLPADSPCVDAGDPAESPAADAIDLDGHARLSGLAVDMGAYEIRNDAPVANAGPDVTGFTLDGGAGTVTLDGSGSYDREGMPLQYAWYLDGELISTEAQFTIDRPIGDTTFTLVVNDGTLDSAPDSANANVAAVTSTSLLIFPEVIVRSARRDSIVGILRLPEGKRPNDFDLTTPLLLFPGAIEAVRQTPLVWLNGHTIIFGTFDRAKMLKAVPQNGRVELRVVGRMKSGQYISGTDTVNIK